MPHARCKLLVLHESISGCTMEGPGRAYLECSLDEVIQVPPCKGARVESLSLGRASACESVVL